MDKPTVLIVEDNAITRKMIRVTLEAAGYGVLEAADGKTALRLVANETPALILQDLLLPDMDGFDLVVALRARLADRQIPILACTGLMSRSGEARSIQDHFTDYLFKPVEPSRLLQAIERYLITPAANGQKTNGKVKVLLVDDDPVELKLEKLVLEAQGFAVITAKDGEEGLQKARQANPDAVLCDLVMPKMNGFDLCVALRKDAQFAALPIVITSSTGSCVGEEDRQLAEKVGADAFVARTPDLKPVVKALRAALQRPFHPQPRSDSEALKENYLQRLVSQIEHQNARNADLMRRAAEEKAQLAVVAGITETLNRKLPLQVALDEALALILDAAGISLGAVYLAEPDGKMALRSQIGFTEEKLTGSQGFFGHSILLSRAVKERQAFRLPAPEIAADVTQDLQQKTGARSILIVPLVAAGEPQGIFVAFSSRGELDDEWVRSVKTVTAQLAQAVLLARTLDEMAKANRVKDEFLSVISHELRTPLSVLMGYAGLLKDGALGKLNHEQERAAEKVLGCSAEQLKIINSILQTTQLDSQAVFPERQFVDVRDLLQELKSEYDREWRRREPQLVWRDPARPIPIFTDYAKLKQILESLIDNALKFTARGTVTVSAAKKDGAREVEFKVSDTGIGIPKEMHMAIFEKLRQVDSSATRRYGGLGLGLYIVKKLSELLGGSIEVQSDADNGAVFTVTLPDEPRSSSGGWTGERDPALDRSSFIH